MCVKLVKAIAVCNLKCVGLCLLCFSIAGSLHAQDSRDEALGYPVGETLLFPSVRIDLVNNSNIFEQASDEESATGFKVSPEVRWVADRRLLSLSARYSGEFSTGSEDIQEFDNHALGFQVSAEPSLRWKLLNQFEFSNTSREEDINPNVVDLEPGDPPLELLDVTEIRNLSQFVYGAQNAKGNIRAGLRLRSFDPGSNADRFRPQYLQFTQIAPFAAFSLRISEDTRAFVELRNNTTQFSSGEEGSDNSQNSILLGFEFSRTGIVGGSLSAGYTRISYDDSELEDGETTSVFADLFYLPSDFSRVDFRLRREFDPRTGFVGDDTPLQLDVNTFGEVVWTHDYSSRVAHKLTLGIDLEDRECPTITERTFLANLEVTTQVQRWLALGVSLGTESRSVSVCSDTFLGDAASPEELEQLLDYDAPTVGLFLRATL